MVSAKVSNAKPETMENKSFKILSCVKALFKDKKKEKAREKELINKQSELNQKSADTKAKNTVASILEPFQKLEIHTNEKPVIEVKDDNELDSFTFDIITIEDDRRSNRIDSQSSEDSGFLDHVVDTLDKLALNDDQTDLKETDTKDNAETKDDTESKDETETKDETVKNKKKRKVVITRGPVKGKVSEYNAHPYAKDFDSVCKPINQINQQTLSGGQVIVNPTTTLNDFSELDVTLPSVAKIYDSDPVYWEDILSQIPNGENVCLPPELNDIEEDQFPIFEFQHLPSYEHVDYTNLNPENASRMFPTPPCSENVPSPPSDSQTFYTSNSEYTHSPERSSPIYHSDFEKYQVISPISYDESFEEKEVKRDTGRASQTSQSSMTMKNFKDLQKEIANGFSKQECCDINRKPTTEMFEEHMQKLKSVERKNLCLEVSKLERKMTYGIIHNILLSLSKECEREDIQYALFALVCQRVLAQSPTSFVGDFGLSILKAAALRCPHRPLLTRHIVYCVYLVLRNDPKLCANECVFHEVDAQGDNLVIACARGGDSYALVLAEMTRSDARGESPPLFRLHHANADGYTALHVACRMHSVASSRLHTVHVLLDHAHADIWKGDIKGGDTALHLAVNSATCCLKLVMTLFKHQDRKQWKKLAHAQNMSSVTPLEYARSASKSTTRQNYPHEVLDFLKKCR